MEGAASPQSVTVVSVPISVSGISIGNLAKRLGGISIDSIWVPLRPNSRVVHVEDDSGVCIVLKEALLQPLASAASYGSVSVPNVAPPSASAAYPPMIFDRVKMVRAMGGIGDGRKMQLAFKFIPDRYVCYVQAQPNSRVVLSKASKEAGGEEDAAYATVLLREVTKEQLALERCILPPLEQLGATAANNDSAPPSISLPNAQQTHTGIKREREVDEVKANRENDRQTKKKPTPLAKYAATPQGAFLNGSTHSALWQSIKTQLAATGLHKPPLHRSKLFAVSSSSTTGAAYPKKVVMNNTVWHVLEPHCVTTSFNIRVPSDLLNLSTSGIVAICVDSVLFNGHHYFRKVSLKAASAGTDTPLSGPSDQHPTASSLAIAYESSLQQLQGLQKDPTIVQPLGEFEAYQLQKKVFRQRVKELALLQKRVVLFAFAPELHHADEKSIESKLGSLACCVEDLASGPDMPPITLLVSVASGTSSSVNWWPLPPSASAIGKRTGDEVTESQSVINGRMLWRAFVRHTNQNKFPNEALSFVVGTKQLVSQSNTNDNDDDNITVAASDVTSTSIHKNILAAILDLQFAKECVGEKANLKMISANAFFEGRWLK